MEDKIDGFGQVIDCDDGSHYIGEWKQDYWHGQGKKTDEREKVQEGLWIVNYFDPDVRLSLLTASHARELCQKYDCPDSILQKTGSLLPFTE